MLITLSSIPKFQNQKKKKILMSYSYNQLTVLVWNQMWLEGTHFFSFIQVAPFNFFRSHTKIFSA